MKATEARSLGNRIARLLLESGGEEARQVLSPILLERVPFRILDRLGDEIGTAPIALARPFLRDLARADALGGWPIIGSALAVQVEADPGGALEACRAFIIASGRWFTTDILAERVLGRALAQDFDGTLARLRPWRQDPDRWVRRALGVGIHNWAKRSRGAADLRRQAVSLLGFLEPLFAERELDAVKGIGWGLKTLGHYYADAVAQWLHDLPPTNRKASRRLMLRKTLTYLSDEQRAYAQAEVQSR